MPLKETPIYLFIYCLTATEMTKVQFKRHIAKVNLPLLLHHNQSISRLNQKVGWNRRNVGNFCKLEGTASKRRIFSKKISFHCISNRQEKGFDPRNPPSVRTPLSTRNAWGKIFYLKFDKNIHFNHAFCNKSVAMVQDYPMRHSCITFFCQISDPVLRIVAKA